MNPPRPPAKGWCPGAHRPMPTGDGWLVRVRPPLARLSLAQAQGLCELALRLGDGCIELTRRANLQLRGVAPHHHARLVAALCDLGLLDADPAVEARPQVLVQPCWCPADLSERLAGELRARLAELPTLPAKFGFGVDAGASPLLGLAAADVRIERAASGRLMVRADGAHLGIPVAPEEAIEVALRLATWFAVAAATSGARRMREHLRERELDAQFACSEPVAPAARPLRPGPCELGPLYGAAFGLLPAEALADLLQRTRARALRLTPFRGFIAEAGSWCESEVFLSRADDVLLDVDACPGAPSCASATVPTRSLARALAASLRHVAPAQRPSLHVSGCSKGCARSRPADITMVGRDGSFDLVRDGCAWDTPSSTGLSEPSLRELCRSPT